MLLGSSCYTSIRSKIVCSANNTESSDSFSYYTRIGWTRAVYKEYVSALNTDQFWTMFQKMNAYVFYLLLVTVLIFSSSEEWTKSQCCRFNKWLYLYFVCSKSDTCILWYLITYVKVRSAAVIMVMIMMLRVAMLCWHHFLNLKVHSSRPIRVGQ